VVQVAATRRSFAAHLACAVTVVFAVTSCKSKAPLASLGGQSISDADFRKHLQANYGPAQVADIDRDRTSRQLAWQTYLDALVLAAKAHQLGIDQDVHFQKAVELMEDKTLAHMALEPYRDRIIKAAHVSADEVRRSYEEHKSEFLVQPHFSFRQVLVYAKGNPAFPDKGLNETAAHLRANQALRALRAGQGWDAVALAYSDDAATAKHGGLIRDAAFGPFAPEIETAVRTHALGEPGIIRTVFGYHVIQVEDRLLDPVPEPFERVQAVLSERLSQGHADEARRAVLARIAQEVGLRAGQAGDAEASLLDDQAADAILAHVAGQPVRESDFRWFVKDAVIAPERQMVFSRPGARQDLLRSFLDMRVLAAQARRQRLDRSADFQQARAARVEQLLGEFVRQREGIGAFCTRGSRDECDRAEQAYLGRIRAEVGLRVTAQP
jgi:peptidyl-prolyl cis-trans isomerase C